MMSMTSAELNYIVFRYLHESGFTHSAYALGFEAGINNLQIDGNLIPPGALVTFVQKGLRFFEIEADLANCSDTDMDEDLSSLQPLDFITKDANQLQKIVKEKKEKKNAANNESRQEIEREKASKVVEERKEKDKEQEQEEDRNDKHREQEIGKDNDKSNQDQVEMEKLEPEKNETSGGMEPMETSPSLKSLPIEIPSSEVTVLEGHTSEVFACAWSPSGSLLASGSGDSTARIWTIADGCCRSSMQNELANVAVLKHYKGRANDKSRDVTTLDWNDDGTLLATGSYDGQARIWSRDGELRNTLSRHKGPIFSLKWNKEGDYLLSGSVDKTAIVWEIKSGEWKQQFEFHSAPTLDVDWRDNVSFATCSTDGTIHVCKVGENQPIKTFSGHQGEVNAIKWDPTGSLLASCSDDQTAKIWSITQDTYLHDLREHVKEIYTIRWSPTGPGTNNPNQQLVLASASFDSSVKLWDVELGRVIYSLYGHRDPVYSVAFSPNGEYLASGSMDKCMHIWSVKEGKMVRTYTGNGGIFEVCWNKEGDKIAACFANNNVCVVDFRM